MSDSMNHSFKILKQTLPLLLKHEVPAIPTNYALWYAYVDNQNDPLNEEIERALADGRPFSDIYTKELYRKHVADKEEMTAFQLRQSVEAMLTGQRHSDDPQLHVRLCLCANTSRKRGASTAQGA